MGRKARHWTVEEKQIILDTYATHSAAQQADLLRRSVASVRNARRLLIGDGDLDPTRRASRRRWTISEWDDVLDYLSMGWSVYRIAKKIHRTPGSIHARLRDNGLTSGGRRQHYSVQMVAQLFGVSIFRVYAWMKRKIMRSFCDLETKGPRYTTIECIERFIEYRAGWPYWDPATMADPLWRDVAMEYRDAAGGCWLSAEEVAAQLNFSLGAIHDWARNDLIPSIKAAGGRRYVWSQDLLNFVPPCERIKEAA